MIIKEYTYTINNSTSSSDNIQYLLNADNEKIVFFDIETTGLYAKNTTLYLIGALWYDNNAIHINQWFNEDGYSEKELIVTFDDFCKDYDRLVDYNGSTFDIPYIREKASAHNIITPNINKLNHTDIFKEIRKYKNLLGLDNLKQVSVEHFLNINREDTYNGQELINIYQRYVARPDESKEHLLLLHNHDDLMGLLEITPILCYKKLFEGPDIEKADIHFNDDNTMLVIDIIFNSSFHISKRFLMTNRYGIYINAIDNNAVITIPVVNGSLRHFFKDYKNYYYLPAEDMAIHKSVATYVSKENRVQATKSNCYVKRDDMFITCFFKDHPESFKNEYDDKQSFITCDYLLNATNDIRISYVKSLLYSFINTK